MGDLQNDDTAVAFNNGFKSSSNPTRQNQAYTTITHIKYLAINDK